MANHDKNLTKEEQRELKEICWTLRTEFKFTRQDLTKAVGLENPRYLVPVLETNGRQHHLIAARQALKEEERERARQQRGIFAIPAPEPEPEPEVAVAVAVAPRAAKKPAPQPAPQESTRRGSPAASRAEAADAHALVRWLKARGLNQKTIAELAGIPQTTFSHLARGGPSSKQTIEDLYEWFRLRYETDPADAILEQLGVEGSEPKHKEGTVEAPALELTQEVVSAAEIDPESQRSKKIPAPEYIALQNLLREAVRAGIGPHSRVVQQIALLSQVSSGTIYAVLREGSEPVTQWTARRIRSGVQRFRSVPESDFGTPYADPEVATLPAPALRVVNPTLVIAGPTPVKTHEQVQAIRESMQAGLDLLDGEVRRFRDDVIPNLRRMTQNGAILLADEIAQKIGELHDLIQEVDL